jgi:hypothetical protein
MMVVLQKANPSTMMMVVLALSSILASSSQHPSFDSLMHEEVSRSGHDEKSKGECEGLVVNKLLGKKPSIAVGYEI